MSETNIFSFLISRHLSPVCQDFPAQMKTNWTNTGGKTLADIKTVAWKWKEITSFHSFQHYEYILCKTFMTFQMTALGFQF